MKTITKAARDLLAALDAYEDDVGERDAADYTEGTADRIYTAKAALREVIADPTPMPAPALGMRVWREIHDSAGVTRSPRPYDVTELGEDETWAGFHLAADEIVLITDYRTHEVLWRRP